MSGDETIYALSSGAGRAAIAVVRMSGSRSADIVRSLTGGGLPEARRMVVRQVVDPRTGEALDEAMVVWLPGPGSFTGEDCAELHVHASRAVLMGLFSVLGGMDGVRLAEAGEFTLRAVLNGKLDLVEAEGLGDLLVAQTATQRRQALGQVLGQSSSVFETWREQLISIRADIEAAVDFAEEREVGEMAIGRVDEEIWELAGRIRESIERAAGVEAIREGVKVVLTGLPNTGKSSLLNCVAGREVAIVSAVPGTTRDVIEVAMDVRGVPVLLTDTAGVREALEDEVESMGVSRAICEMREADVVVLVVSPDVNGYPRELEERQPDVVVWAKKDLKCEDLRLLRNDWKGAEIVGLSAKTGEGVDSFLEAVGALVTRRYSNVEPAVIGSLRQRDSAGDSIRHLNNALRFGADELEQKAEEIRNAADAVGRITGRTDVEEWLGAIFSRFCIGK